MSSKKHKKKRTHTAPEDQATQQQPQQQPASKATKTVTKFTDRAGAPAPVTRRFFAYLIDWYVGALCTAIPISFAAYQTSGDITNQYLTDLPAPIGIITGAVALLFAFAYYILIPMFVWRGQTPGKRRIRIERFPLHLPPDIRPQRIKPRRKQEQKPVVKGSTRHLPIQREDTQVIPRGIQLDIRKPEERTAEKIM